ITHVGVICGKEDAKISSNAGYDQPPDAKISQQRLQRAGKKSGVLRLQDKIIVLLRIELFDERAALSLAAMLDQGTKIGAPSPEIIIDVDHRNSSRFGSPLHSGNAVSQGRNEMGQLFRFGEVEIVNYIHNDERDL